MNMDLALIDRLVEEGKRVGKAPWCTCILHEHEAQRRFGGGMEQESFQETQDRRFREASEWVREEIEGKTRVHHDPVNFEQGCKLGKRQGGWKCINSDHWEEVEHGQL